MEILNFSFFFPNFNTINIFIFLLFFIRAFRLTL